MHIDEEKDKGTDKYKDKHESTKNKDTDKG